MVLMKLEQYLNLTAMTFRWTIAEYLDQWPSHFQIDRLTSLTGHFDLANLRLNKPHSKNSDPARFTTPSTKICLLGSIFKDAQEGLSSRTADTLQID